MSKNSNTDRRALAMSLKTPIAGSLSEIERPSQLPRPKNYALFWARGLFASTEEDYPHIDPAFTQCLFGQFLFALNHQVRIRMGRASSRLPSADRNQVVASRDEAISRFVYIT